MENLGTLVRENRWVGIPNVTESVTDVKLPRFIRWIGITGLSEFGEQSDKRSSIGVLRPFVGVLEPTVRQEQSRHVIPQLAYLTLAPLVTREFTKIDEPDRQTGRTGADAKEPTGADEEASDPRVRDVLQRRVREQSDSEPTSADETGEDADRGGSGPSGLELTTLQRTIQDARIGSRDTDSGNSSPPDRIGWRGETVQEDAFGTTRPSRTVVDPSGLDRRFALDAAHTGDGSTTAGQSGTATPTMKLLDEHGVGQHGTRSDADSSPFLSDVGLDSRDADREDAGPDLTVKRTGQSAQPAETADQGDSDVAGSAQSQAGWRAGSQSDRGGLSTERTVIAEDGSVNQRVFDRLYQELTRKRQIERNRKGR